MNKIMILGRGDGGGNATGVEPSLPFNSLFSLYLRELEVQFSWTRLATDHVTLDRVRSFPNSVAPSGVCLEYPSSSELSYTSP